MGSLVPLIVPHSLSLQLHRQHMPALLPVSPCVAFAGIVSPAADHSADYADPVVLRQPTYGALGESHNGLAIRWTALSRGRAGETVLSVRKEQMGYSTDGASGIAPFAETVAVERVGAGECDESCDARVEPLEANRAGR